MAGNLPAGCRAAVRSEMTFGDWLTYWYENHSKPKIRPTTQETYESRIRLHIIPEIGDIPLNGPVKIYAQNCLQAPAE